MQAGRPFHALSGADAGVDLQHSVAAVLAALDEAGPVHGWQKVAARHPVLRSRLRWKGLADPVQEVLDEVRIPVERLDWRSLSEAERLDRFQALLEADRARGLDLAEAPLMRLTLVRMSDGEH